MILFLPILKLKVVYRYSWKTRSFTQLSYVLNLWSDTFKYKLESRTCLTCSYVCVFVVLSCGLCGGLTLGGCQTFPQPLAPTQLFTYSPSSTGQAEKIRWKSSWLEIKTQLVCCRGMGEGACSQSVKFLFEKILCSSWNWEVQQLHQRYNYFSLNNASIMALVQSAFFFFFLPPDSYIKSTSFYVNFQSLCGYTTIATFPSYHFIFC